MKYKRHRHRHAFVTTKGNIWNKPHMNKKKGSSIIIYLPVLFELLYDAKLITLDKFFSCEFVDMAEDELAFAVDPVKGDFLERLYIKNTRTARRDTPATAPITIPAIAPPERVVDDDCGEFNDGTVQVPDAHVADEVTPEIDT